MESRTLKFSLLARFPELIHGISSRTYGNTSLYRGESDKTTKNREQFLSELKIKIDELIVPEIVHGSKIISVSEAEKGRGAKSITDSIKGADGLISTTKNLFLAVTLADCVPVLVYDPVLQIVGAAHAGWRGVIDGIINKLMDKFLVFGSKAENLVVGIGPGICQKHFTVKNDVLSQFLDQYPKATFVRNKDGYVDLKKAIVQDLLAKGIIRENIEISKYCPACQNNLFGSHRLEKDKAPASVAVIGMRG